MCILQIYILFALCIHSGIVSQSFTLCKQICAGLKTRQVVLLDRNIYAMINIGVHLTSFWSSFKTPRVEHTALPAPSVHHDCLQFACISQPCILQQVVNISHLLPSPVCMPILWLPQDKFVGNSITVSDTMPNEPHSSLLYFVDTGDNSPYSCMLGMCCFHETLRAIRSILV